MPEPTFEELLDAMRAGAGALQRHEIPFVLGGGLAAWARGGPKSEHDVDFMIRPQDADAALEAMDQAGLRTERPPEGWLYKAWHDNGALVDSSSRRPAVRSPTRRSTGRPCSRSQRCACTSSRSRT